MCRISNGSAVKVESVAKVLHHGYQESMCPSVKVSFPAWGYSLQAFLGGGGCGCDGVRQE